MQPPANDQSPGFVAPAQWRAPEPEQRIAPAQWAAPDPTQRVASEAPRLRSRVIGWGVVATVLVVVVALIAALGGFRRSPAHLGPELPLGQQISTRYWDFTLLAANVSGSAGIPGSVMLRMQITSKLDESHVGITQEAIIIRLPDATALGLSDCVPVGASPSGGRFDPGVLTEAICVFGFVLNGYSYAEPPGDIEIEVLFLDQRPARNDFELRGEPEVFLPPVGHSRLPASWAVTA